MDLNKLIKKIVLESLNEDRELFTKLYHGTDLKSAINIKKYGIDVTKSDGYFGTGFYTTPSFELAKSNYADFAEYEDEEFNINSDTKGVVLEFDVINNLNIIDLRDPSDFEKWKKFAPRINNKLLYKELVKENIDGLWDDSMDGVIIYNPNILKLKKIHRI